MQAHNLKKGVFIVEGLRTAVGSPFRGLKNCTAPELTSSVIKELLRRSRIKKNLVDEVVIGNTVSAGIGQNLARQAAVLSGLPLTTPCFTVNHVCGAGLQSIILAAQSIMSQEFDVIVAGGAESASKTPYLVDKSFDQEKAASHLIDSLNCDGLYCPLTNKKMVELADFIARKFRISRKEQDAYAFESHVRAIRAQKMGKFLSEIVTVRTSRKRVFNYDERPRKNISLQALEDLPPVFQKNGTATAGNSSIPCDGAAAVILASEKISKKYRLKPKARIIGYATIADKPEMVFAAGVQSIQKCLKKCHLSVKDIDLFEINEAFATQAILTKQKLNLPDEKVNIFGGDVAIGHPLGSAGTRILVTLLHALIDQNKKRGIASVCIGGGSSIAVAIENVS